MKLGHVSNYNVSRLTGSVSGGLALENEACHVHVFFKVPRAEAVGVSLFEHAVPLALVQFLHSQVEAGPGPQ